MLDPKERFSSRVQDYLRYRPGYPSAVLSCLQTACGLTPAARIADIGSGTGLSSLLFLQNANQVYAVEPNAEMRSAAEMQLAAYPNFHSQNGSAEASGLANASVEFVCAGQAFHWFDRTAARVEFARILSSPDGWVVLFWNERLDQHTPFAQAYEQLLLEYAIDYRQVNHRLVGDAGVAEFFAPAICQKQVFPNQQIFDFAGLRGRLLSSSYAPQAGDVRCSPMMTQLSRIFEKYQTHGKVAFDYATSVYYGKLV